MPPPSHYDGRHLSLPSPSETENPGRPTPRQYLPNQTQELPPDYIHERLASRSSSSTDTGSSSGDDYDDGSDVHSNNSSRRASIDHRLASERRYPRGALPPAELRSRLEGMSALGANAAMAVAAVGRALVDATNITGASGAGGNFYSNPNTTNLNPNDTTSTPVPSSAAATPNPLTGPPPPLPGGGGGETAPSGAPAATTTNGGPPSTEADPPPYHEDLKLIPMTSEQTSRYDRGPLP
jgi:hypothetical protein